MKVKIGDNVTVRGLEAKVVEILGVGIDFTIAVVQGQINDVVAMFAPDSTLSADEQKRIFTDCALAYYAYTKPAVSTVH